MAEPKQRRPASSGNFEVESISSHFLDSGAFTMWTTALTYAKENRCGEWEFYDTDEFHQYLERYAKFIKRYHKGIDLYANVDALPFHRGSKPPPGKTSQELSYRNQKLLEKLGVIPVPIIHNGTDVSEWVVQYVEDGYPLIGLGGMAGKRNRLSTTSWLDQCFDCICVNGKPIVNTHGFGVTNFDYLLRYPWYSVDSTSWTKKGGFGQVLVPRYRNGRFVFTPGDLIRQGNTLQNNPAKFRPWTVYVSKEHRHRFNDTALHYLSLKGQDRAVIRKWFDELSIEVGTMDEDDLDGLLNDHNQRRIVNLHYFENLRASLILDRQDSNSLWRNRTEEGFGLYNMPKPNQPKTLLPMEVPEVSSPIIYYSGVASLASLPEVVLGDRTNIMLTYHDFSNKNKPDSRFRRILRARGHKFKPTKKGKKK